MDLDNVSILRDARYQHKTFCFFPCLSHLYVLGGVQFGTRRLLRQFQEARRRQFPNFSTAQLRSSRQKRWVNCEEPQQRNDP